MEVTDLAAQVRKEQKKGPSRRLRDKGFVPAVFYGRSAENILLAVKSDELIKLHKDKKDHAFIKLIIDDEGSKKIEKLSLIKELQLQPLTGKLYHVDFYEVDEKRKITMDVALNFIGKAIGVENGGELQHLKREVKVSCLPLDLPDHIDVDVTDLEIGDSVKIRDLKVAEGVTLLDRPDTSVASVAMIKVAKVEEAAKEEGATEGAPAEGEAAATAGAAAAPAEKEKGK
ncbi:MAG TPA: 50S ribosomal protein L25 [Smithella sp.]|mgnify:CR=1 FL=1|jgi:large subunit ribosomal protein L25|nr:50S ribosomal protein L25 [Smithella sp.]NMC97965.1 50S ribosomal protein L25 [Deltaproteobacteria bacterium]OQC52942.1 MAG: 50S ribosomal protein L25 [Deltaproteobacteria bacterium ADurb.Bin022]HNQ66080.1 50S ribosomal protein L25 [Smithella sp.]HOE32592.1 50S ribosomal protein L25 [Smithella sp.]